jgi:hypothetical protein
MSVESLIEAHELPSDWLIVDASPTDLPDAHEPVSLSGPSDRMNFDDARETVVSEF